MMNLEQIATRIGSPHLCNSSDIEPLRQLTEKYPFSQAFSLLYLKALSMNNDIRFDEELQKHAYKITDRVRLYELANEKETSKLIVPEIESSTPIITENTQITVTADLKSSPENTNEKNNSPFDIISEISPEKNEPIVENELIELNIESNFDKDIKIIEEVLPEVNVSIENIEDNIEFTNSESETLSNEDKLKFISNDSQEPVSPILDIDINSQFDTNIENTISENHSDLDINFDSNLQINIKEEESFNEMILDPSFLEFEVISHAVISNFNVTEEQETIKPELNEEEVQSSNENLIISSENNTEESDKIEFDKIPLENKKVFSSWLKANVKTNSETELNTSKNESLADTYFTKNNDLEDEESENETIVKISIENILASQKIEIENSKHKINSILDQFIKEEPSIKRPTKDENQEKIDEKPKTEFFSPIKKAKESLDEKSLPVSETLAKIFAAQGNYPKAIYAYEQLCLINPEKKIFFAAQINELTKKLNT
jgi:hypothetical protein